SLSARWPWIAWVLAAAVVVLVCVLAVTQFREPPSTPAYAFTVALPDGVSPRTFCISPDGRHLAVAVLTSQSERRLWVRSLDSLEARELPGTDGARYPFWSPDSRQIGFFAQGTLRKIALAGGPPQSLCDAENSRGGSWGRHGMIVFAPSPYGHIHRVSEGGGEPVRVTKREDEEGTGLRRFPRLLPDGRHFLYLRSRIDVAGIYLASLDGEPPRRLLPDASNALYVSESGGDRGVILFVRENALMAQPFDVGRLEFSGEVFPVVDGVDRVGNLNYYGFYASANGSLVYFDSALRHSQMTWFDRQGNQTASVGDPAFVMSVSLAPDEKRAAVAMSDSIHEPDIWLVEFGRGVVSRFTSDPANDSRAVWSPEGDQVVFSSRRDGVAGNRL
ncbi:MAG: hypothetical protein GY953_28630, partial [bacterium]|nr:hypothetical protein [bacterium]